MKTHLLRISMIAALVITASNAQIAPPVRANVPFGFVVGNKTLTAGEYLVKNSYNMLVIQSADGKQSVLVMGNNAKSAHVQEAGKLVFHRYGNEYFLSEVWTPRNVWGRRIVRTKRERELAATGSILVSQTTIALR